MKIVHIVYDSIGNPWVGGGGATRTHEIYKRLTNNHEITVLCGNYPGARKSINNITYKHVGLKKSYFSSRWSFIIAVWIMLAFVKADIFIEDIGAPGPLLITTLKKNVVGSVQFLPTKAYRSKRRLLGYLINLNYKIWIRFYANIVTVSEESSTKFKLHCYSKRCKDLSNTR
jgi:hypothetical protein